MGTEEFDDSDIAPMEGNEGEVEPGARSTTQPETQAGLEVEVEGEAEEELGLDVAGDADVDSHFDDLDLDNGNCPSADCRRRLEDRLEDARLQRQLNDYDFDLDD